MISLRGSFVVKDPNLWYRTDHKKENLPCRRASRWSRQVAASSDQRKAFKSSLAVFRDLR
jgi:hypothetical protein